MTMPHANDLHVFRDRDPNVLQRSCSRPFSRALSGHQALIAIETMEVIAGELPRRALELVFDWTELHQGN
jgi:hypothetical protein